MLRLARRGVPLLVLAALFGLLGGVVLHRPASAAGPALPPLPPPLPPAVPPPLPMVVPPLPTAGVMSALPAPPPAVPLGCPYPASGFDCDFQRRFADVEAYLASRPGTVGVVVRDRLGGAQWRNGHAGEMVWTASTVKLAMSVDLLLRDRAGAITLSPADRSLIHAMLHSSDDDAADALWDRYGGADFATRFPRYGLTSATFVDGFPRYWGFMKCTPEDLDRLMSYVLTELPADLRGYLVGELRAVASNQQWGVWGAGPAAMPGNKDGWSLEQGGWVMNTVGFVGPGQRYTLAVMNSLRGQGGYDEGRETDTRVAQLIFAGRF